MSRANTSYANIPSIAGETFLVLVLDVGIGFQGNCTDSARPDLISKSPCGGVRMKGVFKD